MEKISIFALNIAVVFFISAFASQQKFVKNAEKSEEMTEIIIEVGDNTFEGILYNNPSAQTLIEKLPLTLKMQELNRNEKYYQFSDRFPTDTQPFSKINIGDLMLYQTDYLVLFYKSHSTSYNYTKLGYIKDTTRLAQAVGEKEAVITFRLKK